MYNLQGDSKRELYKELIKYKEENKKLKEEYSKIAKQNANYLFLERINLYFGTVNELDEILDALNDAVIGILGVSASVIFLDHDSERKIKYKTSSNLINVKSLITSQNYNTIKLALSKREYLKVDSFKEHEHYGIKSGSMLVIPVKRMEEKYGFILIYQEFDKAFGETHYRLFNLISKQLSVLLENAFMFEESKKNAILDGLTKTYNRVYFDRMLDMDKKIDNKKYAVILMSIDKISDYNIEYGYEFTDEILVKFSEILRSITSLSTKLLFRYSKDSFIILLEKKNLKSAYLLAKRIMGDFSNVTFVRDKKIIKCSLSIGISVYDDDNLYDLEGLLKKANEALMYSRLSGNGLISASSSKLSLLVQGKEIIETEIYKARRYKWEIEVKYVHIKLFSIDNPKKHIHSVDESIERALRNSDLIFKSDDMQYLHSVSNKLEKPMIPFSGVRIS